MENNEDGLPLPRLFTFEEWSTAAHEAGHPLLESDDIKRALESNDAQRLLELTQPDSRFEADEPNSEPYSAALTIEDHRALKINDSTIRHFLAR
jgi:hypothetical protein